MRDYGLELLSGLLVHEAAHAMAVLGEEYISCAKGCESSYLYANQASSADIEDKSVHWLEITPESDLTEDWFTMVHTCEDGNVDAYPDRVLDNVGAFWDAMFIDPTEAIDCEEWEPTGCDTCKDSRGPTEVR